MKNVAIFWKDFLVFLHSTNIPCSAYKKQVDTIKELETQISKHVRLQQGLETIYQLAITVILLCYAHSKTKTFNGLSALFKKDGLVYYGISISPELIITVNIVLNLFSFTLANINGIKGHCYNLPFVTKLVLAFCILCCSINRIMAITLYFAPTLGLFDLLFHYKGIFHSKVIIGTLMLIYDSRTHFLL